MSLFLRLRSEILKILGYLVPVFQSMPSLGVWIGVMTVPLISYLVILIISFPVSFPSAIEYFFTNWFSPWYAITIIGCLILIYCILYKYIRKKEGFVRTGPYRWVRHPQYLAIILSTIGLTAWSYWLTYTDGPVFLGPSGTIVLWFVQLFAYVLIAKIEEIHLSSTFKEAYKDYRNQVPYLIPFLRTSREYIDIIVSILLLACLLFGFIIILPKY
ncbi:MAG: methyltransferase family protein [Candidatus Hermodarchaeota archaeon]